MKRTFLDAVYPVGSIYMSVSLANPSEIFGGGTWERIKDRFLLAAGDSYTAGDTGGEANHTLTLSEMPNHRHLSNNYSIGFAQGEEKDKYVTLLDTINGTIAQQYGTASAGEGQSHNNMPPYLVVYIWKRTA